MGPDTARKEFWGRVHWPLQSSSCKTRDDDDDDDGIRLTSSPSQGTSLASTATSSCEKIVLPKAVHALDQATSPSATDVRRNRTNHGQGVLRLLC